MDVGCGLARQSCRSGFSCLSAPGAHGHKMWHEYAMHATEIRFLRGRLKFWGSKTGAPFPLLCLSTLRNGVAWETDETSQRRPKPKKRTPIKRRHHAPEAWTLTRSTKPMKQHKRQAQRAVVSRSSATSRTGMPSGVCPVSWRGRWTTIQLTLRDELVAGISSTWPSGRSPARCGTSVGANRPRPCQRDAGRGRRGCGRSRAFVPGPRIGR